MKKHLLFFLFLINSTIILATTIKGTLIDEKKQPLPFASIYIKGTTTGTSANGDGAYNLTLAPGTYELCFKAIGYKLSCKSITVTNEELVINMQLQPESIQLSEVNISADAEDPAYAIIRNAIKKRKYYLDQSNAYSCDVYIKGRFDRASKAPKIRGKEVDINIDGTDIGVVDTTSGILMLSESVSRFYYQKPKYKSDIVSSKKSGDDHGFEYDVASDALFNFYENLVDFDWAEKGFTSPIANNALLSYKYKLIGTFFEGDKRINKIQVIPRVKSGNLFRGEIYIMEDSWRIHSVDLLITKDANIEFLDTVFINQVHVPVKDDIWMPFNNNLTLKINIGVVKLKLNGYYIGVMNNYDLNTTFPKGFFKNEEMTIKEDANKKDTAYWKESRPIPLTIPEQRDYYLRDSIARIHNSKTYKDSIDKKHNKFGWNDIFFGYNYRNSYKQFEFNSPQLLDFKELSFNTVQGLKIGLSSSFEKKYENKKHFELEANGGYGFASKDVYAKGSLNYFYNPKKFSFVYVALQRDYVQFNSDQPIIPLVNALYSLLNTQNFMKLYHTTGVNVVHETELKNGLYNLIDLSYSERYAVINNTNYTIAKTNNTYTSNDPQYPIYPGSNNYYAFDQHNAFIAKIGFKYKIQQHYFMKPDEKVIISDKGTIYTSYTKGLPILGSAVNFDLITAGIEKDFNLKVFGNGLLKLSTGKYLNTSKMYFIDYAHFNGNQTIYNRGKIDDFYLLNYYTTSTNNEYIAVHYDHNFGGILLNKLPLIRKLKLSEVIKVNYLNTSYSNFSNQYMELAVGISRLAFRGDFVMSFNNNGLLTTGVRVGLINF